MTQVDRQPPMMIFRSATAFLQVANFAHEAIEAKTREFAFDTPVYYLYSHAIELLLKAFLRAKGVTPQKLKSKYGHDLKKLWCECNYSFTLDAVVFSSIDEVVDLLAPYAKNYEFRYTSIGLMRLPELEDVRDVTKALQTAIKPIASR